MFHRSTAGFDVFAVEEAPEPAPPAPEEELAAEPPRGSSHSVPATSAPYSGGCIVIDLQNRRSRAVRITSYLSGSALASARDGSRSPAGKAASSASARAWKSLRADMGFCSTSRVR